MTCPGVAYAQRRGRWYRVAAVGGGNDPGNAIFYSVEERHFGERWRRRKRECRRSWLRTSQEERCKAMRVQCNASFGKQLCSARRYTDSVIATDTRFNSTTTLDSWAVEASNPQIFDKSLRKTPHSRPSTLARLPSQEDLIQGLWHVPDPRPSLESHVSLFDTGHWSTHSPKLVDCEGTLPKRWSFFLGHQRKLSRKWGCSDWQYGEHRQFHRPPRRLWGE